MRKLRSKLTSLLAAPALIAGALAGTSIAAPTAHAESMAAMGGGSGITLYKQGETDYYGLCSLGAIGYDKTGNLIGLTAGHCGQPGDTIGSEYFPDAGTIGTFIVSEDNPDVAIIDLDDSKVTPLRTVGGTTIDGAGAKPVFGDIVCKEGRSTGRTCAHVWAQDGSYVIEHTCSIGGDSGGPVVRGTKIVGLISGGPLPFCNEPFPAPFHAPNWSVNFQDAVRVADTEANGFALF